MLGARLIISARLLEEQPVKCLSLLIDPESANTKNYVRQIAKSGRVKSVSP